MLTRIFKSGNSLAVRIPKDFQFTPDIQEVDIERHGDTLVIRPVKTQSLAQIMQAFSAFPEGFMAEGRDTHSEYERDWQQGEQ
ncbi:MAG: AbrB/MazE/SpoVT family DNA-binding domain-containing protein [Moraxellaceae bacterium]|nr:AbrB/MazE/SpoVT family DNA-binding domain-containing protein [Moraxellaceae bacterium]